MTREKEKKFSKDQLLLEAARLGQVKQLELILKEFQQKSKKRSNPLASLRKAVGPNNIRDPVTGFTCLHHAALNGHSQCVQLILDSGCRVNAVDYKGSSALHLAAWAGNVQVVKLLVEHCQAAVRQALDCDSGNSSRGGQNQSSPGKPPLDYQELDINLCNNDNQTPLSLAAQFGHNQVVAELLIHSANVHLRNNQLESPLDLACLNGRLETVRLLLNFAPELIDELRRAHAIDTSSLIAQPMDPLAATRAQSHSNNNNNQSSPASNYKQHSRRPSGSGWSSLLRTGKSRTVAEAAASSPPPPPNSNRSLVCDNGATVSPNRRATLAAVCGGGQWPQRNKLAADWQTLDYSDLQQQHARRASQSNQVRLLDHSPLHYAVRRGHLQIVGLLLNSYEANVMQVTSLGGILHEIALTYCRSDRAAKVASKADDPGELIGLIFNHLNFKQQREANERLMEKFLNLTNCQHKNVFDILNEFNNSPAQEVRRVICEFSEHFKQAAAFARNQSSILTVKPLDQQQPQMHQLFDNNQQINSFVTMKRLPKHRKQPHVASQHQAQYFDSELNQRFPLSTQTIDRRRFGVKTADHTGNTLSQDQLNFVDWNLHATAIAQQQQVPISMTRSVSNLMPRGPAQAPNPLDNQFVCDASNQQMLDNVGRQQHPLVRSQTDCSHLMGKVFRGDQPYSGNNHAIDHAGKLVSSDFRMANQENLEPSCHQQQQHTATIDRKAINRHYHVYDHEFYPPRLLNNSSMTSTAADRGNNRSLRQPHHQAVAVVPPLNRSESTEASFASPNRRAQVTRVESLNSHHPLTVKPMHQETQSTSSESNSRLSLNIDSQSNAQSAGAPDDHRGQLRQMDRFVGRYASRKSTGSTLRNFEENSMILHQHPSNESFYQAQSSDSNHSFETTRKALVRDFDQMIGRELLNRDHSQLISSREQPMSSSSSSLIQQHQQSKRTILTGVSLDMDTRGERLIVSGTQITLPPPRSTTDGDQQSSTTKLNAQSQGTQTSPRTPSQRSSASIKVGHRKSSHSRPTSRTSSSSSSVIYDLPSTADNTTDRTSCTRTSANLQQISSVLMTPQQQVHVGKQPQQRVSSSITRPPQEKPPPPPPIQAQVGHYLPEMNNNFAPDHLRGVTSGHVTLTNLQNHSPAPCGAGGGRNALLSSQVASERFRQQPSGSTSHQLIVSIQTNADDSGVCTSNSPSSMSHDSTERQSSNDQQSSSCSLESRGAEQQQRTVEFNSTGADSVDNMAPPSPQTAQLSVEEALLPLEDITTHEVANQTNFVDSLLDIDEERDEAAPLDHKAQRVLAERSCPLSAIVGWLDSSDQRAQNRGGSQRISTNGDYENCIVLQRQLEKERCRSIDCLFEDLTKRTTRAFSTPPLDSSSCDSSSTSGRIERLIQDESSDYDGARGATVDKRQLATSKKEVLLKVVVDESNDQGSSSEDVFYIEPSELKKISTSKSSQNNDMETLTDEELCASVDRKSGLIRFTLRKRRAESRDPGDDGDPVTVCEESLANIDSHKDQAKQTTQLGFKKTKLNIEQSEEKDLPQTNYNIDEVPTPQLVDTTDPADTSQAATTTSSSSSRDSIKSIVSMKQLQEEEPIGSITHDFPEVEKQLDGFALESTTTTRNDEANEIGREATKIDDMVPDKENRDDAKDESSLNESTECNKTTSDQPDFNGDVTSASSNGATVRETVEQVTKSESKPSVAFKPIAAARKSQRFNQVEEPKTVPVKPDTESTSPNKVIETKRTGKVSDIRQRLEQNTAINQQKQLPIKRTIRWPPPTQTETGLAKEERDKTDSANEKTKDLSDNPAAFGRVSANRLSFQRLIEEKNRASSGPTNKQSINPVVRPKPAPPAKPANILLSNKFNGFNDANSSRV